MKGLAVALLALATRAAAEVTVEAKPQITYFTTLFASGNHLLQWKTKELISPTARLSLASVPNLGRLTILTHASYRGPRTLGATRSRLAGGRRRSDCPARSRRRSRYTSEQLGPEGGTLQVPVCVTAGARYSAGICGARPAVPAGRGHRVRGGRTREATQTNPAAPSDYSRGSPSYNLGRR